MNDKVMEDVIGNLDKLGLPDYTLQKNIESFKNNIDIAKEFSEWLATGEYNTTNPIIIEGYSAKDIYNMAKFLNGVGVFNFMITLRERPEKAKEYIASGFARK